MVHEEINDLNNTQENLSQIHDIRTTTKGNLANRLTDDKQENNQDVSTSVDDMKEIKGSYIVPPTDTRNFRG